MSGGRAVPAAPEEAYGAALASLPWMAPAYLWRLVEIDGGGVPSEAWRRVVLGDLEPRRELSADRVTAWRRAARGTEPRELLARCAALQIRVLLRGHPGYPPRLIEDPAPPAVLFALGDLAALDPARPSVAVVGTRRGTGYGRQMAQVLGRHLSERDVVVVSGMASGVDAAAQAGALGRAAPVVGVAATGLDVVYPNTSAKLWERLGREGLLLSEKPPGHGAQPTSFVHRNRIMAGLADVVVVVESHIKGGALLTADQAGRRGRTVMAVPGPATSAASAGANALIADGCPPARDALDIQVALGLARASRRRAGELVDVAPEAPRRRRAGGGSEGRQAWRRPGSPVGPADPADPPDPAGSAGSAVSAVSAGGALGSGDAYSPPLPAVGVAREPTAAELELLDEVDASPTRLEVLMVRTGRRAGELALALDALEEAGLVQAGPGWWARIAG